MSRCLRYALLPALLLCCVCAHAAEGAKLSPKDAYDFELMLHEGAVFLRRNDTGRAMARFKEAQRLDPENPAPYFWIGLTWSELQNYRLAAENAEKAVLLDEMHAEAWHLWGQSLLFMGKYPEALEKLDKAFTRDPDNYLIAFNIGRCHYVMPGDPKRHKAIRFFNQAKNLNPDYLPAWFYIGRCQADAGMTLLAVVTFQDIVKRDQRHIDARYQLGLAYRRTDRAQDAEQQFRHVLRLHKEYEDARRAVEDPAQRPPALPVPYEVYLQLGHIYLADIPNRRMANYCFDVFLKHAPAEHPWRARVEKLLERAGDTGRRDRPARPPERLEYAI